MIAHLYKVTLTNSIAFCLLWLRMIATINFDNQASMP